MTDKIKDYQIKSVKNMLKILKIYTSEQQEFGVREMARITGLNKSTTQRLMATLAAKQFLQKNQKNNRYMLGFSALNLSGIIIGTLEVHKEAQPIFKNLVNKLDESAHLGILEGTDVVYIHKKECQNPVPLLSHMGRRNVATCTSSGKCLLAYQDTKVVESIIEQGLEKCGPQSITDPDTFRKKLVQIRNDGYEIGINELDLNTISIAVPVWDYTGKVVAAISVVGPINRVEKKGISMFVNEISRAGKLLSESLGYY